MPVIKLPSALQKLAQYQQAVVVDGYTIPRALFALTTSYPELATYIYSEKQISPFIGVYLNQQLVRNPLSDTKPLNQQDEISIVVAVSGG